ncbi:MAG: hypothetical protein DLM50_06615 [Candidatus Meridianibacter frigidus]|nr:MAG: hypothetical protein DLM50_06615 [Candidatus Eremiobacteraeota bacterium]
MTTRAAICAAIFVLSTTSVAQAQDATTAPVTAAGFTAQGTLVAQATLSGTPVNIGSDITLMSRGNDLRLDILRLGVPGTDAAMNALVQQFLPHGGLTLVVNHENNSMTVWSNERKTYFTFDSGKSSPASSSGTMTAAQNGPAGSVLQLLEIGKEFRDLSAFNASFALVGHQSLSGHTVSVVRYSYARQKRGQKSQAVTGDAYFADDLQGFPVRLSGAVKGSFDGRFQLDLRNIATTAPDPSSFEIPAGYSRAADPSGVFGVSIPNG